MLDSGVVIIRVEVMTLSGEVITFGHPVIFSIVTRKEQ